MEPFKGRKLDNTKPVQVYRNLHKGSPKYSVRQNGVVVAHTNSVFLKDCQFVVNEKGRQWTLKNKHKTVHAYVKGFLSDRVGRLNVKVAYRPESYGAFFYNTGNMVNFIHEAKFVWLDNKVKAKI